MIILGIESSCDETAVGIVTTDRQILAQTVYSQIREHAPHGGVVPEIAARAHVQVIDDLIRRTLKDAALAPADISGMAATCGPGLVGGVMVGMMAGKGLAAALNIPFYAVNHLEAHVLTARLTHDVPFPYLTLLISGGHTQILLAKGLGNYQVLGESLDDACGEAFDKSAKLMGLPYPGGPAIEKNAVLCADVAAAQTRYPLPRPMTGRPGCDFSFSGFKTAVRETVQKLNADQIGAALPDLCASIQTALGDILCDRVKNALPVATTAGAHHFVLAGGVAANQYLRGRLKDTAATAGLELVAPPIKLCTDNGVMIAWAGMEYAKAGVSSSLGTAARPRWPLVELTPLAS